MSRHIIDIFLEIYLVLLFSWSLTYIPHHMICHFLIFFNCSFYHPHSKVIMTSHHLPGFPSSKFAALSSDEVATLADDTVLQLSKPWLGSIPFPVHVVEGQTPLLISAEIFDKPPTTVDIVQYLEQGKHPAQRLYFSNLKYPPPQSMGEFTIDKGLTHSS